MCVEFFREALRGLHRQLDTALGDLTDEQLHYRTEGKGNHLAFIYFHYVRIEDNIIHRVIQGKATTLWVAGEFDSKFGLDARALGPGMSADEAAGIRIKSASDFLAYQKQVWEATDDYLSTIDDAKLDETRSMGRGGQMPIRRLIGNILLTHGYAHLGEIQYIRGLQGLSVTFG